MQLHVHRKGVTCDIDIPLLAEAPSRSRSHRHETDRCWTIVGNGGPPAVQSKAAKAKEQCYSATRLIGMSVKSCCTTKAGAAPPTEAFYARPLARSQLEYGQRLAEHG